MKVKDFCNMQLKDTCKKLSEEKCKDYKKKCEIEETNKLIKEYCETDLQDVCDRVLPEDCKFFKEEYEIRIMNKLTKNCKDKIEKKYGEEEEKIKSECQKELQSTCEMLPEECDALKRKCEENSEKGKIESKCQKQLQKTCEMLPEECQSLKKKCEEKLKTEYSREKEQQIKEKEQETRDECIMKKYLELGDKGELYIKKVLHKFYSELDNNKDIIDKVAGGTYSVKQFGMGVRNIDDNGGNKEDVTHVGNIDTSCFDNISGNSSSLESYAIKNDGAAECRNKILNNDTYCVEIVKVKKKITNIDEHKPVAMATQTQPLIIVNVSDDKLVKNDGTVTNIKFEKYKEFCDKDGRITDCTGKGEECNTYQKAMEEATWDFQGEIPIYMML